MFFVVPFLVAWEEGGTKYAGMNFFMEINRAKNFIAEGSFSTKMLIHLFKSREKNYKL